MKDTSKAAFARPIGERITETTRYYNNASPGMSLREYYAGQALAGIIAGGFPPECTMTIAKRSRQLADALIAELEGGE